MKEIEIQGGIAMPPPGRSDRKTKYPWRNMKVGDSFHVPCKKGQDRALLQMSVGASCVRQAKRWGRKFSTRVEGNGVRVWRTE